MTKMTREIGDAAMQRMMTQEQHALFGELIHTIIELEEGVTEREFVRWQEEYDAPRTYEMINVEVLNLHGKILREAINIAAQGKLASVAAK